MWLWLEVVRALCRTYFPGEPIYLERDFEGNQYYTRYPDKELWQRVYTGLSFPWSAWEGPQERANKRRLGRPGRSIYTPLGLRKIAQNVRPAEADYVYRASQIATQRLVVQGHYPLSAKWGPRDAKAVGLQAWMLSF